MACCVIYSFWNGRLFSFHTALWTVCEQFEWFAYEAIITLTLSNVFFFHSFFHSFVYLILIHLLKIDFEKMCVRFNFRLFSMSNQSFRYKFSCLVSIEQNARLSSDKAWLPSFSYSELNTHIHFRTFGLSVTLLKWSVWSILPFL